MKFLALARDLGAPQRSVDASAASARSRGKRQPTVLVGIAVAGLALFALSANAQIPLTLAEAQRLAVERSRQVVAYQAAVTASREMAVAAAQLPDPVATMGVNNLPINGPDAFSTRDFMTMFSVGLMQEFTRTEKREARAARFEREADKSLADLSFAQRTIQRDTATAWLDRYYAEAQAAIVGEQIHEARLEVDAAETAYRAGRGNLSEILVGRSALVSLDDRASELRRRVSAAKIALARWIGEAAESPLSGKPDIEAVRLDPRTLETELAQHPDLVVFARKEELAAAEVRVAQANKSSDWSVAVMYSQRPQYSNMVSLNVSVPLQWDQADRQDRELAAKLAMLDQARAEREDMLRAHTAEVRAMLVEWENDRERLARYQRELVPLVTERTQATLASYRGAKASLVDVLQARRAEIDVRVQALQLEADSARVWAQLNFLVPADHLAANSMQRQ
jgi:outer membrane protein TolC